MKLANVILLSLLTVCLVSAAALAGPPLNGVYQSTDMGGDISTGRYTETFTAPEGATTVGTTLHAQSWDGMDLGLEWAYSCGVVVSEPTLLSDTVNVTGTGSRTYEKEFVGGTIWLSGDGPWGNGDEEYTGPILSYFEYETIQYVAWERVHAVTNVSAVASIEGYNDACLAFTVGNGVEIGSTDFGDPINPDYPEMLDASCSPGGTYSAWWDMMTLSLYIDSCTVGTGEESTWGAVKEMYR